MRTNQGDAVHKFENEVKNEVGQAFAVCMPQARVGIFLAVRALIRPGQQVVMSPYTIHDVVNMVVCAGGIPVFGDIERRTCNLDPKLAEQLIGPNTGAVLVTHLHGLAMELTHLAQVCRLKGVALIEDCAQAFGTRLSGQSVGTFGDAGIFSFGMYKNLNTFYGGMLVTPHRSLYRQISTEIAAYPPERLGTFFRKVGHGFVTDLATYPPLFRPLTYRLFRYSYLRNLDMLNKWIRVEDNPQLRLSLPKRYLSRMRPMQARIGLRSLAAVAGDAQSRLAFARLYHDNLAHLDELICPPFRGDGSHTYAYYPIQFKDRHALVRHLMRRACDVGVQHLKNCADLSCFAEFARDCPNARATANETVLLPTYPRYGRDDVLRNVQSIREFLAR